MPKRSRCSFNGCNNKLPSWKNVCSYACKCGKIFCALHDFSTKHNCTFDYKKQGTYDIITKNPQIAPTKIVKI